MSYIVDKVNQKDLTLEDMITLALDIDRLMRRIHANLQPKAQSVDNESVGPLGGMILMTIAEAEPVSAKLLAQQLARDKAQMTRILQTLERKALLRREASEDDGRVTLITLTQRGHELVSDFQTVLTEVIEHLLRDTDAEERTQLSNILGKILKEPKGHGL